MNWGLSPRGISMPTSGGITSAGVPGSQEAIR
jgi:hypothetical protein